MHYVRAHFPDGSVILGNLDGQTVIRTMRPTASQHWKNLGLIYRSPRVAYWTLCDERDRIIAVKNNPNFTQETANGDAQSPRNV